jgi:hypothetical protein
MERSLPGYLHCFVWFFWEGEGGDFFEFGFELVSGVFMGRRWLMVGAENTARKAPSCAPVAGQVLVADD